MSVLPTLVVVGRVNEGKTSIVSTLVEDDAARVGPEPGTTTAAQVFVVAPDGQPLFRVVDTPGFQEPERCLNWLTTRATHAAQRPSAVQAFIAEFRGRLEFEDEWRLLEPVLADGFVLYVVDASHPYRKSYDSEMEILRWTGRPAIALMNRVRATSHEAEWRSALQQHFNAVRLFNAHLAGFDDRISLLSLLAELDDRLSGPLRAAMSALKTDRARRLDQVAAAIADCTLDMISLRFQSTIEGETASDEERERQLDRFREAVTSRELASRKLVERILRHDHLLRDESQITASVLNHELFVTEAWEFFGLSKAQLTITGAIAGALGGVGVDAALAGHSLGIGAALGATLGALSSATLSFKEPRVAIKFGIGELAAGKHKLYVGPMLHPNFPWVVLGRAIYHARLLQMRPHARRDPLAINHQESEKPLASLTPESRKRLLKIFRRAQRGQRGDDSLVTFRQIIRQLIVLPS